MLAIWRPVCCYVRFILTLFDWIVQLQQHRSVTSVGVVRDCWILSSWRSRSVTTCGDRLSLGVTDIYRSYYPFVNRPELPSARSNRAAAAAAANIIGVRLHRIAMGPRHDTTRHDCQSPSALRSQHACAILLAHFLPSWILPAAK